jgi:hypothetical protein
MQQRNGTKIQMKNLLNILTAIGFSRRPLLHRVTTRIGEWVGRAQSV